MASLRLLEEVYEFRIHSQVIDSALGLNGAGRYGGQCGLVEGFLMFIGLWARANQIDDVDAKNICFGFASEFEDRFGCLLCSELRPKAIELASNPQHVCEQLKVEAMFFGLNYLDRNMIMKSHANL